MLTVYGGFDRLCSGISRRKLLQVGGAGLFGLTLPKVLAAEEARQAGDRSPKPRAKSVIFLLLYGGPSQLETFDMKPDAPSTLRGPFQPIAARTPELRISEHLPRLAAASDKFCVVRSMTHPYNDHSTAGHYIQTGRPWHVPIGAGFNATSKDWPAMGSIVEYMEQRRGRLRDVPNYAYLPNLLGHLQKFSTRLDRPGGYGGWLGRGYDPLATDIKKRDPDDNPYFRNCTDDELDYRIKGLSNDGELTLDRLEGRRSLLEQFDVARRGIEAKPAGIESYDKFRHRALALVSSPKTRDALDIRQESADMRDRYGRHLFGQSVLVARRLVEAATRFVTVAWDTPNGYSWDSHINADDQRDFLLPGLDQTLSALLEDLEQRGLLDETLVVCCGEMGRTPKAGKNWGRGHWSTLFPAILAGAGVRGGTLYGASDRDAAYPVEKPTSPEDLAATIFTALGIDPAQRIHDPQGRPVALTDDGEPLPIFG